MIYSDLVGTEYELKSIFTTSLLNLSICVPRTHMNTGMHLMQVCFLACLVHFVIDCNIISFSIVSMIGF